MAFNFHAAPPTVAFYEDDGQRVSAKLRETFGPGVPLGDASTQYRYDRELTWAWWKMLRQFARARVETPLRHLDAVDAWRGVYLDVEPERTVLWIDPADREREGMDAGATGMLAKMQRRYGAREGERHALQVGSLRGLIGDLETVLSVIGCPATYEAVRALQASYEVEERIDEDPEIQCLADAWIAARFALDHNSPLWLIK